MGRRPNGRSLTSTLNLLIIVSYFIRIIRMNNQGDEGDYAQDMAVRMCSNTVTDQRGNGSIIKVLGGHHNGSSKIDSVKSKGNGDENCAPGGHDKGYKSENHYKNGVESPLRTISSENTFHLENFHSEKKTGKVTGVRGEVQPGENTDDREEYIKKLQEELKKQRELCAIQNEEISKIRKVAVEYEKQSKKLVKFEALYMQLQNRPPLSRTYFEYLKTSHNKEVNTIDMSTLRVEKSIEMLLKKLQYVEVLVGSMEGNTASTVMKFKNHQILKDFEDLKTRIDQLKKVAAGVSLNAHDHQARSYSTDVPHCECAKEEHTASSFAQQGTKH